MSAQSQTFNRYMYKSFVTWVIGMILGLSFVIFLSNLVENLRKAADNPIIETKHILLLSAYELPILLVEVVPILVFFAAVGCLWWRTRSQELIVARATGLSVWQFLKPLTLVALITGALFSAVINPFAEKTQSLHQQLEARFYKTSAPKLKISSTGFWLKEAIGDKSYRLIRSATVSVMAELAVLANVEIFNVKNGSDISKHLTAERALIRDGSFELRGVLDHAKPNDPLPIPDQMLDSTIVLSQVRSQKTLSESRHFWLLPKRILDPNISSKQRLDLKLRYQKLLALPFNLMALVLLAAIFSLRMQRKGSVGMLIVSGVILALGLHFLGDVLYSLGLSGRIWVVIAVWSVPLTVWLLSASMLLAREDG